MTIREARDYLQSFVNHELLLDKNFSSSFHLKRIVYLLALLGNPQTHLRIIHIAGSKGKGSTSAITAHILKEAGYKVGLYTSPHLNDYRERIRVLSLKNMSLSYRHDIFPDVISEKDFCETLKAIKPSIEKVQKKKEYGVLSFFEIMTALALYYFKKAKADCVILETGLGGRLDATNATSSLVCAITPISLEHTQILGKTIEKIASEKAAIIKDKYQRVIIAPQEKKVLQVMYRRCRLFGIKPHDVSRMKCQLIKQDIKDQTFHLKTEKRFYKNLRLSLLGKHQIVNASTAMGIIEALQERGFIIEDKAIEKGMKNIFWPGRFEILSVKGRTIILDGAHNVASVKALVKTIRDIFPQQKIVFVLGLSKDKDKAGICKSINKAAHQIIVTKARHPRASDFSQEDLKKYFPKKICYIASDVKEAFQLILKKMDKKEIIVVTGSIFIVSEARNICNS